jgi:CubicO group peptidase (beta-lactamase class C family)
MKKSTLFTFLTSAFVCSSIICTAQLDTSSISSRIDRSKKELGKNVVFMLYKDGKMLYKKESGEFNSKSQEPIGATSQWLTTALVLSFVQEGKLSLDDKVADYLPIFAKYGKKYITIRHCLTHNTGIQTGDALTKMFGRSKYKSLEEEVNDFASKKDIETNPGTEFKYSNIGLNIAARILEVTTRRSFDRLMQERITRPLAMKATTFTSENYDDAINPSGGARSSAADIINFMAMLLNKGTFNNKQVLKPETVAMIHTLQAEANQIKNAPKLSSGWQYGMGEWIWQTDSKGAASVVTIPSLLGTLPIVDLCRGYAAVIFTKEINEPARRLYEDIKSVIDESVPGSNCN